MNILTKIVVDLKSLSHILHQKQHKHYIYFSVRGYF